MEMRSKKKIAYYASYSLSLSYLFDSNPCCMEKPFHHKLGILWHETCQMQNLLHYISPKRKHEISKDQIAGFGEEKMKEKTHRIPSLLLSKAIKR